MRAEERLSHRPARTIGRKLIRVLKDLARGNRTTIVQIFQHETRTVTTLQIRDIQPTGSLIDLRHVLSMLGARAVGSMWKLAGVERFDEPLTAVGKEPADQLEALAQSGESIAGDALVGLSHQVAQIIWGEFRAYDEQADTPWVTVRAIDSSWYEVETDDPAVADRVRLTFNDVSEKVVQRCRTVPTP